MENFVWPQMRTGIEWRELFHFAVKPFLTFFWVLKSWHVIIYFTVWIPWDGKCGYLTCCLQFWDENRIKQCRFSPKCANHIHSQWDQTELMNRFYGSIFADLLERNDMDCFFRNIEIITCLAKLHKNAEVWNVLSFRNFNMFWITRQKE